MGQWKAQQLAHWCSGKHVAHPGQNVPPIAARGQRNAENSQSLVRHSVWHSIKHAAPAHAKPDSDYEARSGTWPHSWVLLRHNALAVAPAPAHGHTLTAQLAAS